MQRGLLSTKNELKGDRHCLHNARFQLKSQRWEVGPQGCSSSSFAVAFLVGDLWNPSENGQLRLNLLITTYQSNQWVSNVSRLLTSGGTHYSLSCFFTLRDRAHRLRDHSDLLTFRLTDHYTPHAHNRCSANSQWWMSLIVYTSSRTPFLSTLEHAHFVELREKEITYLNVAGSINSIKIWLTSKLYAKPRYIPFKISVCQGVWHPSIPSLQTIDLNVKRLQRVIVRNYFFTKIRKPLKLKKN